MEAFLPISYLNDFVFCPYSIYLHQVFDNSHFEVYSAEPQVKGKSGHADIDNTTQFDDCKNMDVLKGIYVISNYLGVYGKIDLYYRKKLFLVERKFQVKTLYRGYYYQLWAQKVALNEMGYKVDRMAFFSIKERRYHDISQPSNIEITELRSHIQKIARYDFEAELNVNAEKCKHCIYSSLCDKTTLEHVYA